MLCAVALSSSIRRTRMSILSPRPPGGVRCPMYEEAAAG
jgi:hypothetical protein